MADVIFTSIFIFSVYLSITKVPYLPLIYLMLLSQFKLWLIYDSGIKIFQFIDPTLLCVMWLFLVLLIYSRLQFNQILKKPIVLSHMVFCFIFIASLGWSPFFFAHDKVFRFVIFNTLLLCAPYFLFSNMTTLKSYILLTAIVTTVICFKVIFWPSWDPPPITSFRNIYFKDFVYRPGFVYAGSNLDFYVILSGCYFLSIALKKRAKNFIQTLMAIAALIILHAYCIISGIRKLIILLFIAEIIWLFMRYKRNKLKIVLAMSIVLTLGIVLFLSLNNYYPEFQITISRSMYAIDNLSEAMASRIPFYSLAIDLFLANMLLGCGAGGFSFYYGYGDEVAFPHNLFLEVMAEQGFIGLVIFATFFALYLKMLIKLYSYSTHRSIYANKAYPELSLVVMSCSIAMWIFYQSATDLPAARTLWLIIGLMLATSKILSKRPS